MPTWRPRRALLTGLLVVFALGIGGVASAFWTGFGGGRGAGTTGTLDAVTLSPGSPAATLYPGGRASVMLVISNPNVSVVRVGSLALDTSRGTGGFAVDVGHVGCEVSTFSLGSQTNGGTGWVVPAKAGPTDGQLAVTLTDVLSMSAAGADACQGARVTVYLAAGP
jgi:hypothetical protein